MEFLNSWPVIIGTLAACAMPFVALAGLVMWLLARKSNNFGFWAIVAGLGCLGVALWGIMIVKITLIG